MLFNFTILHLNEACFTPYFKIRANYYMITDVFLRYHIFFANFYWTFKLYSRKTVRIFILKVPLEFCGFEGDIAFFTFERKLVKKWERNYIHIDKCLFLAANWAFLVLSELLETFFTAIKVADLTDLVSLPLFRVQDL